MIAGLGTGDLVPRKTTVVERPRKITPVDPGFQCPRKGGAERPKLKGVNAQIYRSPFSNFGSFVLLLLAPISVVLGASPFCPRGSFRCPRGFFLPNSRCVRLRLGIVGVSLVCPACSVSCFLLFGFTPLSWTLESSRTNHFIHLRPHAPACNL